MIISIDRQGRASAYARAGITKTLITMDMGKLAMLYEPAAPTKHSRIAVVLMHCDQNYIGIPMGPELAARGYTALAVDSWQGGEIDRKMEHLGKMIRFLRNRSKIEKIVLMGHSGGATLMTAYQAVAEKGVDIFRGNHQVYRCTVREALPPADGLMLIDANYGNGVMSLLSLDPAVTREGSGLHLDPQFDVFAPEHGYDPRGAHYSTAFIRRYQSAQAARNERLIRFALDRLERIECGEGDYVDDEPFIIAAADQPKPNNRLIPQDLHLLSHTQGVYDLLHGDGSVTCERIQCLRTPEVDRSFSGTYFLGVNKNSVRGFLSSQAIRSGMDFAVTEDDVLGVDWQSSYASPIGNIEHIQVPTLIMGMTGSYEYLASEMIFRHAQMPEKSIAFVRGASHMFSPNRAAEAVYGPFGDTEKALYDYMASWLERFCE